MSKWALFAAHRYLEPESGARTVGADGRLLRRTWRTRSPAVREEARRRRAARPQPRWPRALGWAFIVAAAAAVIDYELPIPTHARASSAGSGPGLLPITPAGPGGPVEGVPVRFSWTPGDAPPPFRLVVLDEGYERLATADDVGATAVAPGPALSAQLGAGGRFHWYVESLVAGPRSRSPLASFEIR